MENNDLIRELILLVIINVLIVIAYLLKKINSIPPSIPRKFLHITAISVAAYSFVYVNSSAYLLSLGVIILLGNYIMYKKEVFEKKDGKSKNLGVFYVPISYIVLVLTMNDYRELAMFSMLVMAFADAGAALAGEFFPAFPYKLGNSSKTISGSLTFAVITFILINLSLFLTVDGRIFFSVESPFKIWVFLLYTTIVLTIVESLSTKGADNILIPLLSAFFFYLFFAHPSVVIPLQIIYGFIFALLILAASYKLKFLTNDGSYTAFVLGVFIFGLGGLQWSVPLLVFFILSSFFSKIKKNNSSEYFEKGDKRDSFQVLANGMLPALFLAINLIKQDAIWFDLYLVSLATSMADTWATEIGNMKKRTTFWILNLKEIQQGVSGGISLGGTLGGALGSAVLALSGLPWIHYFTWLIFSIITLAGIFGMLLDSLIGATLQRKNICSVCNKITEKKVHCKKTTLYHSGIKWINNDAVNFISALVMVVIVYFILR